jgi:hypothetical protein
MRHPTLLVAAGKTVEDVDTSVDTALGWTPPVRQTLLLHLAVE